jgi:hypothetical protein
MNTNNIRNRKVGVFSAAAALAVVLLMIASPAVVAATATTSVNASHDIRLPFPPPTSGERIILTSTSGHYWGLNGPTVDFGPASGVMDLTVVANTQANAVNRYTLTVSGWVAFGTTSDTPITGGSASMNVWQTFITGSGTVPGGTFTFSAFSPTPTAATLHPMNFTYLIINIHIGDSYYFVLLHVKTLVVEPVV